LSKGVCLNPKDIPPDDLDDMIQGMMIKEIGMFYRMELERKKRRDRNRQKGIMKRKKQEERFV